MSLSRFTIAPFLIGVVTLAGCAATPANDAPAAAAPTVVTAQTVADSTRLATTVTYPGVVTPEQDVKITATASGVASGITANLGDSVSAGTVLMQIEDAGGAGAGSGTASAVAQARLAADQARTSLDLARKSYASLQASTAKDLEQAKASADQAGRNVGHTNTSAADALRSAELAYDAAKLATQQAKTTLDNRRTLAKQSLDDATTNGFTAATTHAATAGSVIDTINVMTGFDERNDVNVSYDQYLGALDTTTKTKADNAYDAARTVYDAAQDAPACETATACLDRTGKLLATTKTAIDATVAMLEKSVTGSDLPQSSATGTSLSSLKSAAVGYQSQINGAISAVNAAKQSIANTTLNNTTTIAQLEQAYALAGKQEASALQNLNTARAQATTQRDQTATGASTATSSYQATEFKLRSQLDAARAQVSQAELAYQNANVALQNLSNNRTITAPIDGQITTKSVATGDAVSPGQQLFTVSKIGNVKIAIYVDDVHHQLLMPGLTSTVTDSSKRTFTASVLRIAPQPDQLTKRFLVELVPAAGQTDFPLAGAVVDVQLPVTYQPLAAGHFFVPLAAVTIGQNESSIFTIADGVAKRMPVAIARVAGEYAEVAADLSPETAIIIDGARTVSEGVKVTTSADVVNEENAKAEKKSEEPQAATKAEEK